MQNQDGANGSAARDGFQHLNQSLERTLDQNRALLEEMACFAKDEALRLRICRWTRPTRPSRVSATGGI